MKSILLCALAVLLCVACRNEPELKKGMVVKENKALSQIKPEKPVKIQLKRKAKDSYVWDIKGDNVDKVIEADRKLRDALEKSVKEE